MYAGITSLKNTGDSKQDLIIEMASRQGEVVPLKNKVNIT